MSCAYRGQAAPSTDTPSARRPVIHTARVPALHRWRRRSDGVQSHSLVTRHSIMRLSDNLSAVRCGLNARPGSGEWPA